MNVEKPRAIFNRDVHVYEELSLQKPEREILRRFRGCWSSMSMLDIGVGSGRTAYTFSALVKAYTGVDYAPKMIEACRLFLPGEPEVSFEVADARDLSKYCDPGFDFVLFSFNGVDYIPHQDRPGVFAQVRSVMKPGARFFFSTHSLHAFPFRLPLPSLKDKKGARWAYRWARALPDALRLFKTNHSHRVDALLDQGWAMLNDGAHGFELRTHYTTVQHQLQELEDAGFRVLDILDLEGKSVDCGHPPADPWLHYLCEAQDT